jgi:hypothetical protein
MLNSGITFTPALRTLVLEAPIVVEDLMIFSSNFAELTPDQVHEVILHFSPTDLDLEYNRFHVSQLNDDFLRALIKNRVQRIEFPREQPVGGDRFALTDDAVVDFCVQQDVAQHDEEQDEDEQGAEVPYAALTVRHGRFTTNLFKRLVEVMTVG